MKRYTFLFLSLLVATAMVLGACAPATEAPVVDATEEVTATEAPTEEAVVYEPQPFGENLPTAPTIDTPLVVAYQDFSQKFSPFFADTGYDVDVEAMTQIAILTTDRVGGIVNNAIEGELRTYNGTEYLYKGPADTSVVYDEATDTTKYTAKLRVGMKFSDGVDVTADDIIFSYYTLLDPSYIGSSSLASYDIVGLKDYQTQTTSEVFAKYDTMVNDIFAAGEDHEWSDADAWTQEQQDDFWARWNAELLRATQTITDYVVSTYADAHGESYIGHTADEIKASDGLAQAFAIALWSYGDFTDGVLTTICTEKTFDLVDTFPTVADQAESLVCYYDGDAAAAMLSETPNGIDIDANVRSAFIGYWGPLDEAMGGTGVPNIAGIVKVDDYTVEVTVNGYSAPAVYSILGIEVSPMHYYGDVDKYDYANNMFGFDYGDLSKQLSLTATPMGAGPYKFIEYANRTVYFEANEFYYRGCPKIAEIQFKETASAEFPSAVQTGTADAGELTYSSERYAEIKSYNSNGEMTGDVITSSMVDNLGYGYIGLNAATIKVGDDPASEASKDLRKALATIFAVHRDVAIDSYYGEGASVINYPISNTSWAAPQPTDEGYRLAYSVDVNGDPIYTADMALEDKIAAAEAAALGFLEAAGFTVDNGVVTEAPEGAKLEYEIIVPGDGTGDHPAFAILTSAQASMANIGMTLKINDPADANILWDALDSGEQEMWTAAWGSTIDPDMYQIYYSGNIVGVEGSSESNHYHIQDAELDQLIMDARLSDDQNYRKAVYKQCLDIILDWAVEVPTYQRLNVIIFSTERINLDTLTPDITTFWGWLHDIELVEMN
ncbi:MAG: ABC transporter substrate-binding protein [Anaerolineaceae bacterium]|nr:ABC transporter substrate-binding protein [Anaerolineaceae bacterium]